MVDIIDNQVQEIINYGTEFIKYLEDNNLVKICSEIYVEDIKTISIIYF